MKWLLITTIGKNPGDEFARIGVQKLIEAVDPKASYVLVDKETNAIRNPVHFDRAVVCGMPLFWSHGGSTTHQIPWWHELNGWVSREPRKLLVAGAGSFTPWPMDHWEPEDERGLLDAATMIRENSYAMYFRDHIANVVTGLEEPVSLCPSVFAVGEPSSHLKLCNLMPSGGHYGFYNPHEAAVWSENLDGVADVLLKHRFKIVCHSADETALAKGLGWGDEDMFIYQGNPIPILNTYRMAGKYFGNRVHGAIVSRSGGADTWSVGIDSRQEAVRLTGARVSLPSHVDINELDKWCQHDHYETHNILVREAWEEQLDIFEKFAS